MSAFLLSPEADEDVWNIWRYLAEEIGVSVANRIEAELFRKFEMLARTPGIGHRRADLTSHPVSFLPFIST
jgi:antitoxin ParD1/3/4/toxin ParE1/3/4